MFYDQFVKLCEAKGTSPSRAAIEAGLSKSTISKWKTTPDAEPSGTALKKLSEYFSLSVAEVLGEKPKQKEKPAANDGSGLSVEERVEQILEGMANDRSGALMLDGKPASPEAIDALRQAIKMGVEYARKINKEK